MKQKWFNPLFAHVSNKIDINVCEKLKVELMALLIYIDTINIQKQ